MKEGGNRIAGILLAAACCALASCGDDPEITVPGNEEALPAYAEQAGEERASQEKETQKEAAEGESSEKGTIGNEGEEISIVISAAGDVTMGNFFGQSYEDSFWEMWDKKQDAAYFLESVYDIFSSDDMTIVNLEGSLTFAEERNEDKKYCINGDPAFVSVLTAGSVEAVSMGNNHRLDHFEAGTADTVKALKEEGIVYAYDTTVGIYETKGIRIGFVSINETEQQDVSAEKILEDGIARLKEEGVDLILACCHWGVERKNYPEEWQQDLGKNCIDWGADIVIGHHPHVVQGVEEYRGKYIVYSLGNFCFGANENPPDKDCFIFQQTFTFAGGKRKEETRARVIPCSVSSVQYRNDYKPTPAVDEEAQRIIGRLNEYSEQFGVQFDEAGYVGKAAAPVREENRAESAQQ